MKKLQQVVQVFLVGLSAKKKGVYIVAVKFRNGKKSLIEINDKIFKTLIDECY